VTTVYVTHDQTEALTLGDRIAVLRAGRLQQAGSPEELYLRPANLFVAGFIGSPSMNFVTGTVSDGVIRLPFAQLPLDRQLQPAVERLGAARDVILGVRPEDLHPVNGDTDGGGLRFDALVDTVESTGADLFAHARVEGAMADSKRLDEDATEDAGASPSRARDGTRRFVARLDPTTGVRPGARMTLRAELPRVYLFDAASGAALVGASATPAVRSAPAV
jgi:multiple sugar transport system ATP-binding protein